MYAVIRIRGSIGLEHGLLNTFKFLRLNRKNHCVLITDKDMGMVRKVKDWITWGVIDEETLKAMIFKRGRKIGNARLSDAEAKEAYDAIISGKKPSIKPVFRLSPPSKGFRHSIKQQYPKGEIGNRKEKINELLKRMI